MKRFFFTFGTSEQFPYRGGWVEVHAPDYHAAVKTFRKKFPDIHEGIVNCSDIYSEARFEESEMSSGNLGAFCHEVLFYEP